jgi:hypothetical protein
MSANIVPRTPGQGAAASLDELAKRVREAHAGFDHAVSNAILHAINAGQALIPAKELTPHGEWGKFLARCDVGERQAERYMRLAGLAAAIPTCESDLAGLTIEAAIKKLSPPKPHTTKKQRSTATAAAAPMVNARTTHLDVIAAWNAASPAERIKAVDSIGVKDLLAAVPDAWWPVLEKHVDERQQQQASASKAPTRADDDDLIPGFLRRSHHVEHGGAA